MAGITLTERQRHTLGHLLEGPLTRMALGVTSHQIERLESQGFVKRAGTLKPKRGRPGLLYKLTDKGRKRVKS